MTGGPLIYVHLNEAEAEMIFAMIIVDLERLDLDPTRPIPGVQVRDDSEARWQEMRRKLAERLAGDLWRIRLRPAGRPETTQANTKTPANTDS